MEEDLVTYEQAVLFNALNYDGNYNYTYNIEKELWYGNIKADGKKHLAAPLKSQVFRWFRKTYKYRFHCPINVGIPHGEEKIHYFFNIIKCGKHHKNIFRSKFYKTHEEAESACIDKLIELVKQQKSC